MPKLDDFEKDILESVENNKWQSKGNLDEKTKELQSYLKNQKKKAMTNIQRNQK